MGYSPWGGKDLDTTEQLSIKEHHQKLMYESVSVPPLANVVRTTRGIALRADSLVNIIIIIILGS